MNAALFHLAKGHSVRPAQLPVAGGSNLPRTARPVQCASQSSQCRQPQEHEGAPGVTRRTILLGASAAAVAASPPVYAAPVPPFCGVVERVPSWVFSTPWEEQLVEFHGLKTWTRSVGKQPGKGGFFGAFSGKKADSPTRLPLLCLHGGPGLPSRYLETLELLTGLDRRVVFYDQIGCGNSYFASGMRGPEQQEISPQLFMEELRAVREALDLQQVHLFGHGWGGMLALSAILDGNATGIASLTLASTPSSYKALIGDRQQLIQQLPEEQQAALRAGAPTVSDPAAAVAYATARQSYQQRFLTCRPQPGCLAVAERGRSTAIVEAMCGPSEFQAAGQLADWSIEGRLQQVNIPALLTRGEFDEVSDVSARDLQRSMPDAELATFPGAASYVHIDDWEPYIAKIDAFLKSHDAA